MSGVIRRASNKEMYKFLVTLLVSIQLGRVKLVEESAVSVVSSSFYFVFYS